MDSLIKSYEIKHIDDDLVYCRCVAYQKDMTKSVEYGEDYYEKYIGYEGTEIADRINEARTELTEKYCGVLLDVGIGSGEFIKRSKIKVYGYDINPYGMSWLKDQGKYVDPYEHIPDEIEGVSLWDTLEHIPNPSLLLDRISSGMYVFISIPIFQDVLKVKESKHYRPNEHYYYFQSEGIVEYMEDKDFQLIKQNSREMLAGRQDILSFVFRKV